MNVRVVLLVFVACVPSIPDKDPRGAAGFISEPSPAARGEPFQTTDGWTVRVEKLALQVAVTAIPTSGDPYASSGQGGEFVFDGSARAELFEPALKPGRFYVTIRLRERITFRGRTFEDEPAIVGLDDATVRRFADVLPDETDTWGETRRLASAVLTATGTRGSRTVRLDLNLSPSADPHEHPSTPLATVDVPANAAGLHPLDVRPEILLADFDLVARADTDGDGDGTATVDELKSVRAACADCLEAVSVYEELRMRLGRILLPR